MKQEFWIKRDNIRELLFVEHELESALAPNEILVKIVQFAFTANNISYAHSGEALGYWKFFPTHDDAWGKLPVWGYGDVIASTAPEIPVGEHIYGYFPMASHVRLLVDKVSPSSFVDAAPHRQALSPVYNRYSRMPQASVEDEALNSLLRPMFTTSFLLDDFLADSDFFEGDMVIASSASSKTAYGMAFLLHENRAKRRNYEIVGLTSPKNVEYVTSLGCYDRVLTYEDVMQLNPALNAVYVDFASNANLRRTIHEHFGDNLRHDAIVGGTHWDKLGTAKGIVGVSPVFFFAPTHLQKRMADWGREEYQVRMDAAWDSFLVAAKSWIDLRYDSGREAIHSAYQTMLNGESDARQGLILSL